MLVYEFSGGNFSLLLHTQFVKWISPALSFADTRWAHKGVELQSVFVRDQQTNSRIEEEKEEEQEQ